MTDWPQNAVDAHVHLLGDDFPLSPTAPEAPPPGTLDDWLARYRTHLGAIGCTRGLIVHSIVYGTDNSVTLEAVKRLGDGFRGVGLLPDGAAEADVAALAAAGVVAIRLNYVHGGVLTWDGAKAMAPMLADHGLHIQMLCHADQHMDDLAADVRALPVPVVFDHCAWPSAGLAPDGSGIDALCGLLADGAAYVKLSALNRLCDPPYDAADALVRRLIDANPDRCLWGSDWPHIMLSGAGVPEPAAMISALTRVASTDEAQRILVSNPERLFGL